MNRIPTAHIGASSKDMIADTVLMPGDPLRAKYISETYLEDVEEFTRVRGMLGFTGTYQGKSVSVMGSGMGVPSAMIYYHELFDLYDVETIIRIGTAGSRQPYIALKDIVVATAAATDSNINTGKFGNFQFCPTPDFDLVIRAKELTEEMNINAHFGQVTTGDQFYDDLDPEINERLAQYGVLAAEMEAAGLYTTARKLGKKSLALFTVSDSLVTDEADSASERELGYTQMMELALRLATE